MLAGPSLQLFLIILGTDLSENQIKDPLDDLQKCGLVPTATMLARHLPSPAASMIQTRMIVGGSEAQPGAWPWQIAVLDRKKSLICGGTLITSEFVLTAAHCVTSNMNIVAGEYNLADEESEERQERRVAKAIKHPRYNKTNVDNDIALLKLEQPLQLTQRVWPACLPQQGEELESEVNATILGWGATRYLSAPPGGRPQVERDDMLHEARVPIVDYADCQLSYGLDLKTQHVVCAGYEEGQIDSCAGDSGGPLLVERQGRWHVYGVTSYGDECGKEGKYGIYSKTSAYVDWVKRVINKYSTTASTTTIATAATTNAAQTQTTTTTTTATSRHQSIS